MSTPGSKYLRTISGKKEITLPDGRKEIMRVEVQVDIYDVLNAWRVTDPALQHALKKIIQPGERGNKTAAQDLREAIYSIERCLENTRPETVMLNDMLNIVAPVTPSAPFPAPKGMPNTAAKLPEAPIELVPYQLAKPDMPVSPFYSGADEPLLYGKVLNNYSRVKRIICHQNDDVWLKYCAAHNMDKDSAFKVCAVLTNEQRLVLDVDPNYEWDVIKFHVV